MKFERFEDVPVWKASTDLTVKIFELTENRIFTGKGDIANQIQRAALSISNNIAEGFERGTTQELITFLYYARGSAGEVRSILAVMERMPVFSNLTQISDLKSTAESIARQLRGWADSLQNSDITGQRYLTEKSKHVYKQNQEAKTFLETLKKTNEETFAKRKESQSRS